MCRLSILQLRTSVELQNLFKTKIAKVVKMSMKINRVFEDLGKKHIHSDIPRNGLLQIHLLSALYDLWGACYEKNHQSTPEHSPSAVQTHLPLVAESFPSPVLEMLAALH